MDKLLYISMTGASEALTSQAFRANNLANANTTGFKADFNQYRSMPVFGHGHPSRVYAMQERPASDFAKGYVITTGNNLDIAIKGDGWLAVELADGSEAYTRAGDLTVDVEGRLTTGSGLPVVGNNGPIIIPAYESILLADDGTISVRGAGEGPESLFQIDRIKLVNPDVKQLVKKEDGLFHLRDGSVADADGSVRIEQGALEGSNVQPVKEMVEMISASRLFEMNMKMLQTAKQNDESSAQIMKT